MKRGENSDIRQSENNARSWGPMSRKTLDRCGARLRIRYTRVVCAGGLPRIKTAFVRPSCSGYFEKTAICSGVCDRQRKQDRDLQSEFDISKSRSRFRPSDKAPDVFIRLGVRHGEINPVRILSRLT
jgi:hypothetical protein